MNVSKWGSKYQLDPKLVPNGVSQKAVIMRHDDIDQLTQIYLKNLAAMMGIEIEEMGHFDTSAEVRDLAIKKLEEEFSSLLPPIDFEF